MTWAFILKGIHVTNTRIQKNSKINLFEIRETKDKDGNFERQKKGCFSTEKECNLEYLICFKHIKMWTYPV